MSNGFIYFCLLRLTSCNVHHTVWWVTKTTDTFPQVILVPSQKHLPVCFWLYKQLICALSFVKGGVLLLVICLFLYILITTATVLACVQKCGLLTLTLLHEVSQSCFLLVQQMSYVELYCIRHNLGLCHLVSSDILLLFFLMTGILSYWQYTVVEWWHVCICAVTLASQMNLQT